MVRRSSSPTRPLLLRLAPLRAGWGFLALLALGPPPTHADVVEVWVHRHSNVVSNSDDRPRKAVCDAAGDIIMTGTTEGGISGKDMLTIKCSSADGSVLWEKRYNGPANGDDFANAVAVDSSDNVVVTGTSASASLIGGGGWIYHAYTAKYSGADGALLWEKRHNGPAHDHSNNSSVAVNDRGDVVVAMTSRNGDGGSDYYTAKYSGADGALLWEKRYDGPDHADDFVVASRSLALGPNGMVAVTGTSSSGFATVVYREVLPSVAIDLVSTGVRLRFTNISDSPCRIERAPAATGPWNTLATPTAPASGVIEYVDTDERVGSTFYRTTQP